MTRLVRLESFADLAAAAAHPIVDLAGPSSFNHPAYAVYPSSQDCAPAAAVAFTRASDHGIPGVMALGSAAGIRHLFEQAVVQAWVESSGAGHVSAPRPAFDTVPVWRPVAGGCDWDWMWITDEPPHLPGEREVAILDPSEGEHLTELLHRANPRTHGQPFARPGQLWVGVRDTGRLIACGVSERPVGDTPILAGISVAPERRGEGWGAAVTAFLTRRAIASAGACTLGLFADNDHARELYRRLGYTLGAQFRSRWFPPREVVAGPGSEA